MKLINIKSYYKTAKVVVLILVAFFSVTGQALATGWTTEGNLYYKQYQHKTVVFNDGKVFIAGGIYTNSGTNHTQLFTDGAGGTGTWARKANMSTDRKKFTLNLVTVDGSGTIKALAAGGGSDFCSCIRNSAELYSESSNTWSAAANMNQARWGHDSSMLNDGSILVTGGASDAYGNTKLSSTEIYDPINNTWTTKQPLNAGRMRHKQITFTDNGGNTKIMVIGGDTATRSADYTTEIYDPSTDQWSAGPSLTYGRSSFAAVLLNDGRILVVGSDSPNYTKSEVYDPYTNSWTTYTTSYQTRDPSTVVLGSSAGYKVLVAGGSDYASNAMLFDPSTNTWSTTNSMGTGRGYFTLSLLNNGNVLAAGGINVSGELRSSEEYTP